MKVMILPLLHIPDMFDITIKVISCIAYISLIVYSFPVTIEPHLVKIIN